MTPKEALENYCLIIEYGRITPSLYYSEDLDSLFHFINNKKGYSSYFRATIFEVKNCLIPKVIYTECFGDFEKVFIDYSVKRFFESE